jgi:hypothetical protein
VRAPDSDGIAKAAEPATKALRSGAHGGGTQGGLVNVLSFARLKWTSFAHSAIYLSLLVSAFAAGQPEPLTAVLGWTHGGLWIGMSAACLVATRRRIIPLRVAVAVAVLGGVGPFFGSLEFAREERRRVAAQRVNAPR